MDDFLLSLGFSSVSFFYDFKIYISKYHSILKLSYRDDIKNSINK